MKTTALLTLLLLIAAPAEASAKSCSIPPFSFNITSQGPWPARMTVKSGESCGSRYWIMNSFSAKRLYLAGAPQHGKVTLSAPGGYRYSSLAGYTGSDSFTLQLCGTSSGGSEGCANLQFSVNVVNQM